ncbi:hypothetical protein [Desulfotomaculum nigrificans]|uniref:hypothetical protein n=1 Tax=Desulfotomaculum nigrificans TaxID=1565 RepID=UPI0001FAE595|nr:hypothetical protein [Desulfotomaculum nigrificans]
MLKKFKNQLKDYKRITLELLKDQRGEMNTLITVVGLGLVAAAIIAVFLVLAPDTARSLFEDAIDSIRGVIGL